MYVCVQVQRMPSPMLIREDKHKYDNIIIRKIMKSSCRRSLVANGEQIRWK